VAAGVQAVADLHVVHRVGRGDQYAVQAFVVEHGLVVVDATDNFASKFLIADVCHRLTVPYSHGGICEFFGQTMTVLPGKSACYRCIFERPPGGAGPPRGPLGVLPGVIGTIQATEAVKYLLGIGELLTNALLTYDALKMAFRKVRIRRNPSCVLCG